MQIKEQEIDHVTVQKTIGEITEHPGEKQSESDASPRIVGFAAQEQNRHDEEGDKRKRNEESVVVPERPKGGAGIGNVHQGEKIRNNNAWIGWIDEAQDKILRDLVEDVERQGEIEKNLHRVCYSGEHMRPRVHQSAPRRTEEGSMPSSWFLSARPNCSRQGAVNSTRGACAPRSSKQRVIFCPPLRRSGRTIRDASRFCRPSADGASSGRTFR